MAQVFSITILIKIELTLLIQVVAPLVQYPEIQQVLYCHVLMVYGKQVENLPMVLALVS